MKTEHIQIRISEEDKKALADLSAQLDVPASQIVRECVREKIAKLQKAEKVKAAKSHSVPA